MYTNRHIWNISYPIFLSLLAQNVINVTDTAFLGRVGEVELGASAMGGLYYICAFTIAFGFSTGSQIVIGRRNGERNFPAIGPVVIQGILFLMALAGGLFLVSRMWAGNLMRLIVGRDLERDDGVSRLAAVRVFLFVRQCHVPRLVCRNNENESVDTKCRGDGGC